MILIGIFFHPYYSNHSNSFDPIEKTKTYILETVSPIFNKKGYAGTSMSDLTKATGLTKGAIYGNFENKQELAVQAFKLNLRKVVSSLNAELGKKSRADKKLFALTHYYRNYYKFTKEFGGCPIVNLGADSNHTNPVLFRLVKTVSKKLEEELRQIIRKGVKEKDLRNGLDAGKEARNIYSMIEGSILMASIHDDARYLRDMMDQLDERLREKLLN